MSMKKTKLSSTLASRSRLSGLLQTLPVICPSLVAMSMVVFTSLASTTLIDDKVYIVLPGRTAAVFEGNGLSLSYT